MNLLVLIVKQTPFTVSLIDNLLDQTSSFVYGQSPTNGPVPIYAMISTCPTPKPDTYGTEKGMYSILDSCPNLRSFK